MFKKLLLLWFFVKITIIFSQTKVTGTVYNEYLETFANAKVTNSKENTSSNINGEFTILVENKIPQELTISADGYQTEKIIIENFEKKINVILKEQSSIDEVVVSASRIAERIIESPVTIERLNLNKIKTSSSDNFYEELGNLKETDIRNSGYTYSSINTRGFADMENLRFIQLIDGVDTSAPGFNYSFGNIPIDSDLDIESVEILPGASSALYGANAYNGLMLVNTKNPFDYEGISARFKGGIMSSPGSTLLLNDGTKEKRETENNAFYDVSLRLAHKFSEVFAAKVNFSHITAEEWKATDYRNKQIDSHEIINGNLNNRTGYNGINAYGDETPLSINHTSDGYNHREGFLEKHLVDDFKTKNIKFSTGLFLRPFKDERLEIQLGYKSISNNNILQKSSKRLVMRDYSFDQSKLDIKGKNFYIRGYYTKNDAGKSYDLETTGAQMYDARYYPESITYQDNAYYPKPIQIASSSDFWGRVLRYRLINGIDNSIEDARNFLKNLFQEPIYGTSRFNSMRQDIISKLNSEDEPGSKIYDKSSYIHTDGNYNFTSLLNNAIDLQVGGSYRKYSPKTKGTIFNDKNQNILVEEYGVYTQIQKKFLDEHLKITGSLRYDKSKNFEGNFSPRLALTYNLGENRNHTIRASYQTGFRNPSLQEQYAQILFGKKVLGTAKENIDNFTEEINNDLVIKGSSIINNAILTRAYFASTSTGKKDRIIFSDYKQVKPESVNTFELGYRSLILLANSSNLNVDANAFYSIHNDFISTQDMWISENGTFFPNGNRKLTTEEENNLIASYPDIVKEYNSKNPDSPITIDDVTKAMIVDGVQQFDKYGYFDHLDTYGYDYLIYTNAKSTVNSYGFSLGLSTKFLHDFEVGANYKFAKMQLTKKDEFFEPNFNTPEHSLKFYLGNNNIFKNFGFKTNVKWQSEYRWVSSFVKGYIEARTIIDGQINYSIPSMKSVLKLGGTNLFGKQYEVAPGMGNIGRTYYLSWIINE